MSSVNQTLQASAAASFTAAPVPSPDVKPMTLGWVVRRALLGIVILAIAFGTIAWLTYSTIEHNNAELLAHETVAAQ